MTDCIIIGGGIIGMLTARELDQAGLSVTLVERGETGQESSWAGGGILSPLYPWRYPEAVTRLAAWGQARYRTLAEQLAQDTGLDPQWLQSGLLILDTDELEQARSWAARHGVSLETVGRERIAELEPALADPPERAIWLPEVAQVRNPRMVAALRLDLERRGVLIRERAEVRKITAAGTRVRGLETDQGLLEAPRVIVCAGAWTAGLLEQIGELIHVQPVRGQMILFGAEPGVVRRIVLCQGRYLIPRMDGQVLMGSTVEYTGFHKATTDAALTELSDIAVHQFPTLRRYPVKRHWAGLRPGSPQGIPYIGPFPGLDGLYVNSGHFRYGVTMSLASAELLRNEIKGEPQPLPVEEYRWH